MKRLLLILLLPLLARADRVFDMGGAPPRNEGIQLVEEADATGGAAYRSTQGKSGNIFFAYSWETMGVYEAVFRLKVADNTSPETVVNIRYHCETTRFDSQPPEVVELPSRALKGTDFAKPGVYQDFTVRWLAPQVGRNGWAVSVSGVTAVTLDTVTTRRLRPVDEGELFKYLPGDHSVPVPKPRQGPWRVHVMKGFFYDFWLLDMALPRLTGVEVTSSSWTTGGSCAGQPGSPEALYGYDLLVMAGTDIDHLGIRQRLAVKAFVEAGGSLLMLGGPASFGEGHLAKSVMGELLPVEVAGPFDLERGRVAMVPAAGQEANPVLKGIDFAQPPLVTIFRHRVTLRPDATLLLGTPEAPLLAVRQVGKGRVAAMAVAPMGRDDEAQRGDSVFWNDPRTPRLLANLCRYLITREAPADPIHWQPPAKPSPEAAKLIDKLSMGDLELGDLEDIGKTDANAAPQLTPEQIELLRREGGKPAVPNLLTAIPALTDQAKIRSIEWAVRPFVDASNREQIGKLTDSMHAMIREAAVGLMGKAYPNEPPPTFGKYMASNDPLIRRAALRSVYEGNYRKYLPQLKKLQPELMEQVRAKRDSKYEGYWFDGVREKDPLWACSEVTMALLQMGESGYLADAEELLFVLHIQDLKIRSFIFLYNPKVPREAEAAERHHQRNAYVGPDLRQLLVRYRHCLSSLPPALQGEFRESLLKVDDYEQMLRLLSPAYDLASGGDAAWQAFLPQLEAHTLELALKSKRL